MAVTGVTQRDNSQQQVAEGVKGIKDAQDTAQRKIASDTEMASKVIGGGGAPSPAAQGTATPRS